MDRALEARELVRHSILDFALPKVLALTETCIGSTLLVDLQPSTPTVWVLVNDDATHFAIVEEVVVVMSLVADVFRSG